MTKEEAKEVFLNRGFINGLFDGDKWRQSIVVISEWLEQESCEDCPFYVDKYKAKSEPQMKNGLTTYQIYLILLGYLADHDDGEMLKPILTELYRKAEWEQMRQYNKPIPDEIVVRKPLPEPYKVEKEE